MHGTTVERSRSGDVAELSVSPSCEAERLTHLAHELRNSLAAVCAALRLLEDNAGNAELERIARETLGRQLETMTALVAELEQ